MLQVSPLTSYHHRRFWRARRSLSNMFKNTIRVNIFTPSTPRTMNSGGNSRVSTSTAICPVLQPTSWEQSKTYLYCFVEFATVTQHGERRWTGLTSLLISTPSLPFHPMKGCRGLNHRLPAQQTRCLFSWANRVAFYLLRPVLSNSYLSFAAHLHINIFSVTIVEHTYSILFDTPDRKAEHSIIRWYWTRLAQSVRVISLWSCLIKD